MFPRAQLYLGFQVNLLCGPNYIFFDKAKICSDRFFSVYLSLIILCFAQILHVPSFETIHAPFGDSGTQLVI